MKKLSLLFFTLFMLISCNYEINNIYRSTELNYITIDTNNAKRLDYFVGDENLITDGIRIIGHYSDMSEKVEDIRIAEFEGFDSSVAIDKLPIKVTYEGFEDFYYVSILDTTIQNIKIKQKPTKLFYRIGETLDLDGIVIIAYYTDGKTTKILDPSECVISGFDTESYSPGRNITVSYQGKYHDSFSIVVVSYEITGISIKPPKRSYYTVGEAIDLDGLIVNATKTEGSEMSLNSYEYQVVAVDENGEDVDLENLPAGELTVIVGVNDYSATFPIHVLDSCVQGFFIPDLSGRIYCKGEVFHLSDYEFYEKLTNGQKGDIIDISKISCNLDGKPLPTAGIQKVTAKYTYYSLIESKDVEVIYEFDICVTDSKLDRIEAEWTGLGYPLGVEPNDSNSDYGKWTIKGVLVDDSIIDISSEFCTFRYRDLKEADYTGIIEEIKSSEDRRVSQYATVEYYDARESKTFACVAQVFVKAPIIIDVNIIKMPRTNYVVGEVFDIKNLEARATYTDGNIEIISGMLNQDLISFSPNTPLQTIDKTITIRLPTNYTFEFSIQVSQSTVTGIDIARKQDANPIFRLGEKYTTTDFIDLFEVTARYNTNEANQISSDKYKNLNFSIKEKEGEWENRDTKTGIVYAVYHDGIGSTYSTSYEKDEGVTGYYGVKILPPLPIKIEMSFAGDSREFDSIGRVVRSENTTYTIHYKYGESKSFKGSKFEEIVDSYSFQGMEYTYEINEQNNTLKISYVAKNKAIKEASAPTGEFIVNLISGITLEKKNPNQNLAFRKGEGYEYSNYFTVKLNYNNGATSKLNLSDTNNNVRFYQNINGGKIYCTYNIGVNSYTSNLVPVTYLDPSPEKVEITSRGKVYDANETEYKIWYKDGTVEKDKKWNYLQEKGFSLNPTENNNISITYKTEDETKDVNGYSKKMDSPTITYDEITSIDIDPVQSANISFKRADNSCNFGDYFDVTKKYFSTHTDTNTENVNFSAKYILPESHNPKDSIYGSVVATYKGLTAECSDITFTTPDIVTVLMNKKTDSGECSDIREKYSYTIYYKGGENIEVESGDLPEYGINLEHSELDSNNGNKVFRFTKKEGVTQFDFEGVDIIDELQRISINKESGSDLFYIGDNINEFISNYETKAYYSSGYEEVINDSVYKIKRIDNEVEFNNLDNDYYKGDTTLNLETEYYGRTATRTITLRPNITYVIMDNNDCTSLILYNRHLNETIENKSIEYFKNKKYSITFGNDNKTFTGISFEDLNDYGIVTSISENNLTVNSRNCKDPSKNTWRFTKNISPVTISISLKDSQKDYFYELDEDPNNVAKDIFEKGIYIVSFNDGKNFNLLYSSLEYFGIEPLISGNKLEFTDTYGDNHPISSITLNLIKNDIKSITMVDPSYHYLKNFASESRENKCRTGTYKITFENNTTKEVTYEELTESLYNVVFPKSYTDSLSVEYNGKSFGPITLQPELVTVTADFIDSTSVTNFESIKKENIKFTFTPELTETESNSLTTIILEYLYIRCSHPYYILSYGKHDSNFFQTDILKFDEYEYIPDPRYYKV